MKHWKTAEMKHGIGYPFFLLIQPKKDDNAPYRAEFETRSGLSMKTGIPSILVAVIFVLALYSLPASAQSYSINWYKIAGGGGTSTGAQYTVSGTIGQPDASGTLTGGNYSLTGGFWAFISVMQTPGAPVLHISISGKTVTVYWQNISGWTLIQSPSPATPINNWTSNSSWTTTNGTNYLNISSPTGTLYFRLANP
jgi:hypothetical protein